MKAEGFSVLCLQKTPWDGQNPLQVPVWTGSMNSLMLRLLVEASHSGSDVSSVFSRETATSNRKKSNLVNNYLHYLDSNWKISQFGQTLC